MTLDARLLSLQPDVTLFVADGGYYWGGDIETAEYIVLPEGAVQVDRTGVRDFWAERDREKRRSIAEVSALAERERARDRQAVIEMMQARGSSEAEIELNLRLLGL